MIFRSSAPSRIQRDPLKKKRKRLTRHRSGDRAILSQTSGRSRCCQLSSCCLPTPLIHPITCPRVSPDDIFHHAIARRRTHLPPFPDFRSSVAPRPVALERPQLRCPNTPALCPRGTRSPIALVVPSQPISLARLVRHLPNIPLLSRLGAALLTTPPLQVQKLPPPATCDPCFRGPSPAHRMRTRHIMARQALDRREKLKIQSVSFPLSPSGKSQPPERNAETHPRCAFALVANRLCRSSSRVRVLFATCANISMPVSGFAASRLSLCLFAPRIWPSVHNPRCCLRRRNPHLQKMVKAMSISSWDKR